MICKTKIGNICSYGFLFLACLIFPLNWSDDKVFMVKVSTQTYREFISTSARPIIDSATYFFESYQILWRLITPFVFLALVYIICKIVPCNCNPVSIYVMCIIPAFVLVDAGFIATTLNYLYPVTFGLIAAFPLIGEYKNTKVKIFYYPLSLVLLLYTSNMQQMISVLILIFSVSIVIVFLKNKKISIYALWCLVISIIGFLNSVHLNMTGENNRMERSCRQFFSSFSKLNLFEKIELGFSSTFFEITTDLRQMFFIFMAFTVIIAYAVLKIGKNKKDKLIAVSVPVIMAINAVIYRTDSIIKKFIFSDFKNYKMENAQYSFSPVADIIYVCIIIMVLYSLYRLMGIKEFIVSFLCLMIGTASRMIMGFSPTVWASGYRTFFIMVIALIIVLSIVIDKLKKPKEIAAEY